MHDPDQAAIARLRVFAGMTEEELERLLRRSSIHRCPAETILFEQDADPDFLHVLIGGVVELFQRGDKRECGLMLMTSGDVFMPAASLFEEPYLSAARTLAPSRLLLLEAEVAREEFRRCGRFTFNMSRIMAGHFRLATRQIIDLKSRSAPQRLADFLLRIADASGNGGVADLPVPKRHLAHRVGMTPETLSRNLQVLADNGLLVRGTKILVRDRERIAAFCGPSLYPDPTEESLAVNAL